MFSHSPLQSKKFLKKKDLYSPRTIKKKRDLYSNPLKTPPKKKTGDETSKIGAKAYFIPYYFYK